MSRPPAAARWSDRATRVELRTASPAILAARNASARWGFSSEELARVQGYFRKEGREPTDVELAGLAQSWSEHCSYKSSRPVLREHFGRLPRATRVLGTGDAGVVAYAPGRAYALRIESHNHPSAVEPYGGAATGIGGILRDVLAVGARPIALADPLFFGPTDLPAEAVPVGVKSPEYLFSGVVAGIRDYGNRVGVPTVAGGVYFDPAYIVNPLVNVGCLGEMAQRALLPNRAQRAGDALVLVGGLTGRDGIGGVAFASMELSERSEEESRGAVQLGNPIMKEPLIRACRQAFEEHLVRSLKDLGGGGLATASGELVHAGGFGSEVDLDTVPLREPGLRPWEVWISESQERMLLEVAPAKVARLIEVFRKFDVPVTVVGRVVRGKREHLRFQGETVADLDLAFRIEPPPVRRPKAGRTGELKPAPPALPVEDVARLFEEMVLAPDSVAREPVIRVYEHEVQGRTVLKPMQGRVATPTHGDAAVLRPDPSRNVGLAVAVAAQPWSCRIDPRRGAALTVEEVARNLYAVGARPDSFTNCLNFGNPEDPQVMGDLDGAVRGLAEAARALAMVVPSGNVSLYNGGLGSAIPPTPVVMGVGVVPDVRRATTTDLKEPGDALYLLGPSDPALGGSLFARRRGAPGGPLPPADPAGLKRRGDRLLKAGARGLLRAAHDISDGGLAVTLAEMAFGGGLGFEVDLDVTGLATEALALVAEGGSRHVVEVAPEHEPALRSVLGRGGAVRLGWVRDGPGKLRWHGRPAGQVDLRELYPRWREGLHTSAEPRP